MTIDNRDLFKSFGNLLQNRALLMAVAQQYHFGGQGSERNNRGQMGILRVLVDAPAGLTNAEIAEILDIRPSSVSATLNRLEDAELIVREPSSHDKRVVIVRLSDKSREMADHRVQGANDFVDQLFGNFTDEEREQFQQLVTKLGDNASQIDVQDVMQFSREHGWGGRPSWGHGHNWFK